MTDRDHNTAEEKCACPVATALLCTQLRYGIDPDEDIIKEPCQCVCHKQDEYDDDDSWVHPVNMEAQS